MKLKRHTCILSPIANEVLLSLNSKINVYLPVYLHEFAHFFNALCSKNISCECSSELQERLEQQSSNNSQERVRLQSLITKLELQLTEQQRDVEQERWRLRQEESRLKSCHKDLEEEKATLMATVTKERAQIEKAKVSCYFYMSTHYMSCVFFSRHMVHI